MKPLVLKMKAFGSYAKETIVNFKDLDSGLYLITGDTGAGKTTIFDAMVFALYGVASGSFKSVSMFHSDYVSKKEDTIVELEFIHNHKNYKLERKIHLANKRDGSFDEGKQSATLYEEGELPLDGATKVSLRISEILGLDANQFRQIIVLAQGEFEKFLKADSKERNDILGKLFDNREYLSFNLKLKKASEKIDNIINDNKQAMMIIMENFKLPLNKDPNDYLLANPDLKANLELLVSEENNSFKNIKLELDKLSKDINELNSKYIMTKVNNKALDDLKILKSKYQELLSKQKEYQDLECLLNEVNNTNKIIIYEKNKLKAKKTYDDNQKELEVNEKERLKAYDNLNLASIAYKEVESLDKQKLDINQKLNNLNDILNIFKPYNETKTLLDSQNLELKNLENEVIVLNDNDVQVKNKLKEYQIKETSLNELINKLELRKLEYQDIDDKYHSVIDDNGLINQYLKIEELTKELKDNQNLELKLINKSLELKNTYDELYKAFIKSQASILAKNLKLEIIDKQEAYCPVCHHHLVIDDINELNIDEKLIQEKDVKKALDDFNKVDKKRINIHNEVDKLDIEIKTLREQLLKYIEKIRFKLDSYEDLSLDYLKDLKDKLFKIREDKLNLVNESLKAIKDLEILKTNLDKINQDLEFNNLRIKEVTQKINDLKLNISALNVKFEGLFKNLNGLSYDDTINEIKELKLNLKMIDQKINDLNDNRNKALEYYNHLESIIKILKDKHLNYHDDLKRCIDEYNHKLDEYHLSEIRYRKLAKTNDIEKWIKDNQNKLKIYLEELKSIKDQIDISNENCKDLAYGNLDLINQNLKELNDKYQELTKLKDEINLLLVNHQDILKEIKTKDEMINHYYPAYQRLKRLSDLANGFNAEGGKLSFDRYVMGNVFKDILRAANEHLNIMTLGQYELIHKMKADSKSSLAGLDIEVYDALTNEKRKTDSLSGGEKFEVSMALALGLSDIMQDTSGARRIESMYIDEGFGTLDDTILDKAIEVLRSIAGNNRQIGIISHVIRLEEIIDQKIIVKKTKRGSELKIKK